MIVILNGERVEVKPGARLKDVISRESHSNGSLISIRMPPERLERETNDFEIVTTIGRMTLHLNDSEHAEAFKGLTGKIEGSSLRWVTRDIVALGSFPTDLRSDSTPHRYRPYDCFFSLGGNDNHTTYMMIAKDDHKRSYGAGSGLIGRITVGRHIIDVMDEGEDILGIRPVTSVESRESVMVTKDLDTPLEDGHTIDTHVLIDLDDRSPVSAEQILAISAKGYINVTDSTGTFIGCRDDLDVKIPDEFHGVREEGTVTVRCDGVGTGEIFIYMGRRQTSHSHNLVGTVVRGEGIVAHSSRDDKVSIRTNPPRLLSVGMSQSDGGEMLSKHGIRQTRKGDVSDDAIIVDQIPEMTLDAVSTKEVETIGVPKGSVHRISLIDTDPQSIAYFRKVTGLSHKPIGTLKTQFAFPGMPMVTFEGDQSRSQNLYPQNPFKRCNKGDIGITNQSRPNHGMIGIRLEASKEYGPTGEEPYGTNIIGRFLSDFKSFGELEEGKTIYIQEEER